MATKKGSKGADAPGSADVQTSDHAGESLGAEQVQEKMDAETERGYRGTKVDPTPDENYTVAGVTSGAPTPETDVDAAREAGSLRFTNLPAAEKEKK